MMPRKYVIPLFILIAVLLAGCSRGPAEPGEPPGIKESVTFYYGVEGNEELVTEEREITYLEGEDRYQVALEALISGPETEGYTANIAPETQVYGTIQQGNALLVNVSQEFQQFGGSVAETVAVLSLVNTMTQFEEIERVKILVEGEELIGPSGEPRGFMERFDPDATPPDAETQTIILYFANQDAAALVAEERTVTFFLGTVLGERLGIVLEELIRGPVSTELVGTIPEGVSVLSVDIEDNLVTVNFSEEMHTNHPGGAAGETMTILSIANTLTEFTAVEFVQMNVEGAPMNIDQVVLDAPVVRNEAIIEEQE